MTEYTELWVALHQQDGQVCLMNVIRNDWSVLPHGARVICVAGTPESCERILNNKLVQPAIFLKKSDPHRDTWAGGQPK